MDEAVQNRDYLAVNVSAGTARRCLTNFSACCGWAVSSKLIAYLFPSPEGKFIDLNNFRNRPRKGILGKLPDVRYGKLYQTRHTFITLKSVQE